MIDKTFSDYVADRKDRYKYSLKFAVSDMTDDMIDLLESCLIKYSLVKASAFRKTPIQLSPLDFPNIKNTPVFICDIELEYPAALDFLRTYVCNSLDISLAQLVVYSENDPRQIETDLFIDRNSPEFKEKYKTALGNDYEETGNPDLYGDKYNLEFLKTLADVRKQQELVVAQSPLNPPGFPENSMEKDYHSYNDKKNLPADDVGLFGRLKRAPLPRKG